MIQYNHEDILNDNEHNNPEELVNLSNILLNKFEEICNDIINNNNNNSDINKVKLFYNLYIEFEKLLLNRAALPTILTISADILLNSPFILSPLLILNLPSVFI